MSNKEHKSNKRGIGTCSQCKNKSLLRLCGLCESCYRKSFRAAKRKKQLQEIVSLPGEVWKPVVGWEGYYEVSSLGRVKTLPRTIEVQYKSGLIQKRNIAERIRVTPVGTHGYNMVQLKTDNTVYHAQVHRLVAMAFIPNPNNLEQVNHKNGIRDDNRVENLEWVTRYENSIHAVYKLGHIGQYKCKPVKCVETGKVYRSMHEAARETGCPVMCISDIANHRVKKNGKHIYKIHGLSWEFV